MKLNRRYVFSRLTKILKKHDEFDAIYINQRRQIDISRIHANRFLKAMNRDQLLEVHKKKEWNEQKMEEEDKKRAEEEKKLEEERKKKAEEAALIAAEKKKQSEAIRRAQENLGIAVREIKEETIEEFNAAQAGTSSQPTSPTNLSPTSLLKKKKNRKQQAHQFELNRLREEEKAKDEARKAATDAANAQQDIDKNIDPFSPEEAQIYVEYIHQFALDFQHLYAETRRHIDRIKRSEQMYQHLHKRLENFALDVLLRRVTHDPLPILDHKAHRDWTAITCIPKERVKDILNCSSTASMSAEMQLVQAELANDYTDICSVFRAYSKVDPDQKSENVPLANALGGCLLMFYSDFTEWCKDIKLQSRTIKQSAIDNVWDRCTDGAVLSTEALSPNQFAECLLRCAVLKYPLSTCADSLALFLKQDVLKKCKQINPTLIRARFQSPEYIELLRKHRRKLRKLFISYSAGNGNNLCGNPSAERNTMDVKDFINVLKFGKVMGGGEGLSVDDVQAVFVNVKRSEYLSVDNEASENELSRMDYSEFCQALVTLATYKNPDPFTSLFIRADHFLTRDFAPSNK